MRVVRSPLPLATAIIALRTLRSGSNQLRSTVVKIRPATMTTSSAATPIDVISVPRPAIAADLS
jgi:hypothetical protein